MRYRPAIGWVGFVIAWMIVLAIACVQQAKMGKLSTGTPQQFESWGEVDRIWEAEVEPFEEYTIIVKPLSSSLAYISIGVYDDKHCQGKVIASQYSYYYNDVEGAALTFAGPQSGDVCIRVIPGLGDLNQSLGDFTIEMQKASWTRFCFATDRVVHLPGCGIPLQQVSAGM